MDISVQLATRADHQELRVQGGMGRGGPLTNPHPTRRCCSCFGHHVSPSTEALSLAVYWLSFSSLNHHRLLGSKGWEEEENLSPAQVHFALLISILKIIFSNHRSWQRCSGLFRQVVATRTTWG